MDGKIVFNKNSIVNLDFDIGFVNFSLESLPQNESGVINYRQTEKKILDEILGKNVYDSRLRPPGHNDSCKYIGDLTEWKQYLFRVFFQPQQLSST